jgi:hypothetical protein
MVMGDDGATTMTKATMIGRRPPAYADAQMRTSTHPTAQPAAYADAPMRTSTHPTAQPAQRPTYTEAATRPQATPAPSPPVSHIPPLIQKSV